VRRLTAFFFLFVYLFANTELHELAKVTAFVAHFAEHRKENRDLTLAGFIGIHYFSGNKVDDDYAKDMELPFKTADCSNSIPTHTIPLPLFYALKQIPLAGPGRISLYDQSALRSSHLADIWQPPKAC